MSEPKVQPDSRVFALTAVHHEPGMDGFPMGITEFYEDAVTAEGRIAEGESLDDLADRAVMATLGVRRPHG